MKNARAQLQTKASIWIDQMAGVLALADSLGQPRPNLDLYYRKIASLYEGELELSRLLDTSDIIVHATGSGIQEHQAAVGSVTNLFSNVEKQIKRMAQSVLHLGIHDEKKAIRMLDIRLTGIAPGSLYAGFVIAPPDPSELLGTEEQNAMMGSIKEATLSITSVPQCIDSNGHILEGLSDFVEDPAVRDSAILAAFHLSPTGRSGISSIDLINPSQSTGQFATLNASHRQLLREVSQRNPLIKSKTKSGSFTGILTKIDLDKSRVDLREIGQDGFDSLRCILPTLTVEKGREILGRRVRVTGQYEETSTGRPGLMQVTEIQTIDQRALNLN
jgi:hypothetical protein